MKYVVCIYRIDSKLCKITMFTKYFNEMFHYFKSKKIKTNVYISQDIVADLQHTN